MNAPLTMRVFHDAASLGPEWDGLFAAATTLGATRAWLSTTIEAAVPAGSTPQLVALSDGAGPLALVPLLAGPGRHHGSLTSPYTCLYQPLWRPDIHPGALRLIGSFCRRWPVTRLEALDAQWSGLPLLRAALAGPGLACRAFSHFGNWYERVESGGWDAYLARRPGALRETIRRRTRASAKHGDRLDLAREGAELRDAIEVYEQIQTRSWKQPEPYPEFSRVLVRELATAGVLRISTMWRNGAPIAAQYWSVIDGTATVLKLAHDEAFKAASPGTVLTAATIRGLIEADRIRELDFGRGDDEYKKDWVGQRRTRIGLLGLNLRTVAGLRTLAMHDAGTLFRRANEGLGRAQGLGLSKPGVNK